tara:strand:+ start:30531 stop:30908 length:378 start_codon:yes stop_codon:yes gene_type:complete
LCNDASFLCFINITRAEHLFSNVLASDLQRKQSLTMSQVTIDDVTFGSGRYSKRKRTQVTYHMDELDFSDSESDYEGVQAKVRKTCDLNVPHLTLSRSAKLKPSPSNFPRTESFPSCSFLQKSVT